MFKVNDYVVYGLTGVCQIADIRKDNYNNSDETEYYVLKPVFSKEKTTIMVPVNSPGIVMRALSTRDDVLSLIARMPKMETDWIDDDRQRTYNHRIALRTGKTEEWAKIIKTLYQAKEERTIMGKKLVRSDEDLLNTAEKYLYEEFALVLNIPPDKVVPFISDQISSIEKLSEIK